MGNEEAVLFANDCFYTAFGARDVDAMEDVWGEEQIVCIHPGWQPLFGREEVLASWRAILGEDSAPDIRCRAPRAVIMGETALVVCIEDLDGSLLCATNMFRKDDTGWKMVHHQAGPVHMGREDLPEEPDVAVN